MSKLLSHLVLSLLAALAACSAAPTLPPSDGGVPAAPPPSDVKIINPSRFNTVLGRPTDRAVSLSVLAAAGDSVSVEYGAALDAAQTTIIAPRQTPPRTSAAGEPVVLDLDGLEADRRTYYRVHYTPKGQPEQVDALHSFRTQRAPGQTFHFGVQGDTHPERANNLMFHADLFTLTMQQVRDRQPDLYFMLGDDFSIEDIIQTFKTQNYGAGYAFRKSVEGALPLAQYQQLAKPFAQPMLTDGTGAQRSNAAYLEMRQRYLGIAANATSLFLVNGNHEETRVGYLGGVFNNASIWAADGRLKYYPLPAPGSFYTGDVEPLRAQNGYPTLAAADGLLRDYYAFTWGDALFVTIDPYWHSPDIAETTAYNGDPIDNKTAIWQATLGDAQYAWLKKTLEGSTARWKFVFAHHVNGTGRGGVASAVSGEWGGPTADFATRRPGWAKPVHQLFVDTKVTIFFQGHDHMFARETLDGVIYQEVPNPGDNSYFAFNCDAYAPASIKWQGPAGYGRYDAASSVRLPDTGFLDVTVAPTGVRVEYVRTYRDIDLKTNPNGVFTGAERNGEVAFAYSVPAQPGDSPVAPYTCIGSAPPATWVYNP